MKWLKFLAFLFFFCAIIIGYDINLEQQSGYAHKNVVSLVDRKYTTFLPIVASNNINRIQFKDITESSGILYSSEGWGAYWGDYNNDGYPDLWVTHHLKMPSLYLNLGDGSFIDIADKFWTDPENPDTHGAIWADFDNDGDQDLFQTVGGGKGVGEGANMLFVNTGSDFKERAQDYKIDLPLGRGRSGLFYDWDNDGRLDLLINNIKRSDGQAPPVLFRQNDDQFEDVNHLAFGDDQLIKSYYAQLSDLTGDNVADFVIHIHTKNIIVAKTPSMQIFDGKTVPYESIVESLEFPTIPMVTDYAISDFNGDLRSDILVVTGSTVDSAVSQVDPNHLEAYLKKPENEIGFEFNSIGDLNVKIFNSDVEKTSVYIGENGVHPEEIPLDLKIDDPQVWGIKPHDPAQDAGIYIGYDTTNNTWTFLNAAFRSTRIVVSASQPISDIKRIGFDPYVPSNKKFLLINNGSTFVDASAGSGLEKLNSCWSVTSGDFDNDMDIDIYLVCSGPAGNLPNVLYSNRGDGTFFEVSHGGGATGSELGRGDSVSMADFDKDGFLDLFITNGGIYLRDDSEGAGPDQLFHNIGRGNHWLMIDLLGTASNRDGIGARVVLLADEISQVRQQGGGIHRAAQDFSQLHFGLAASNLVKRITVYWPSGIEQILCDIPVNQVLQIVEEDRQDNCE